MYTRLTFLLLVVQILATSKNLEDDGDDDMHPRLSVGSTRLLHRNFHELSSQYWIENAQRKVEEVTERQLNKNIAKNVILFLGDGMSIPTLAAARVYNGGEETELSFEKFPYTALSKTYAVDKQVPDSANTATAYLCGVKGNTGTIGVGPEIQLEDCLAQANTTNHVHSIAYYSQLQNKRTGLVTTATVTHASPAGVYAHVASRMWEDDRKVLDDNKNPQVCLDIATQLVLGETGKNLNVVMGGGRRGFLPKTVADEEGKNGHRENTTNLISLWLHQKESAKYIWNRDQLLELGDTVDNVLGLFSNFHMNFNLVRNKTMEPSLSEMTEAAINILSRGENGYFLFVEGAKIDMGHHLTQARLALDETIEFSKAVQTAVDLTDEADTLIVVTSDHAHTMSFGGYAERGNDIFEFAGKGDDDIVYTTLTYANGPGYRKSNLDGFRYDPSEDNYQDIYYKFPSAIPLESETHGGDDVAVFARGPWAHLFTGVLEQNVLPHLMAYASCVGDGVTACEK